jgi:hypothetical protein
MNPSFAPGRNIAIKCPPHDYDRLVAFYRDTVGLPVLDRQEASTVFDFGALRLWVDRVPTLSQAEIWLELLTDDADAATRLLAGSDAVRCDPIESLPDGFRGFWILAPGSLVHLIAESDR